jgi:hypothetical protein
MAGGPVTFFDPDLMKFGNAMSPFVQMPSYETAQLAMQRPFEDRYNPRYENQPTWTDYMGFEDEYVGGGPVLMRIGAAEGIVDKRALVVSAVIAGLTTLFALREKDHALEIVAAGAAGIALTWGLSATKNLTASR